MSADAGGPERSSTWALVSTIANVGGRAATLVAWFFLTPYILRHLGVEAFAIWVLASAIAGYLRLVEFGIGSAITRSVARHAAAGDIDAVSRVLGSGLRAYGRLAAICLLLSLVIAPIGWAIWAPELLYLAPLAGLGVALSMPTLVPVTGLSGLGRFDLANLVGVTGMALYAIAIVAVVESGLGLTALVVAEGITSAITSIPAVIVLRRTLPGVRITPAAGDHETMREMLRYGRPLFGMAIAAQLHQQSDELIIGVVGSTREITPYALARRLAEFPAALGTAFGRIVLPAASGLGDDLSRLRELMVTSTRVTLALLLAVTCPLLPLAHDFLAAWAGAEYVDDVKVAWILLVATTIDMSTWPSASILQAISRHGILAWQALAGAAINIALSIALYFPFGVTGVAIATLIAAIAGSGFLLPWSARAIGLPVRRFALHAFAPALLPIAPALLVSLELTREVAPGNLIEVAFVGAIGSATYLALFLIQPWASAERELVATLARRLRQA